MNKQNTDTLCNTFTCLYNKNFYFECNDGWFDLIHDLSEKLNKLILKIPEEQHEYIKATQVKEKFGTLRFYMSTGIDKIFDLIKVAEKKSAKICEICGQIGQVRTGAGGWLITLCNDCYKKRQ